MYRNYLQENHRATGNIRKHVQNIGVFGFRFAALSPGVKVSNQAGMGSFWTIDIMTHRMVIFEGILTMFHDVRWCLVFSLSDHLRQPGGLTECTLPDVVIPRSFDARERRLVSFFGHPKNIKQYGHKWTICDQSVWFLWTWLRWPQCFPGVYDMANCSVLRPYRSKIFEDKVVKYKKHYNSAVRHSQEKLADMAKIWPKNGQAWSDMAGVLDMWQITFVSSLQIFVV